MITTRHARDTSRLVFMSVPFSIVAGVGFEPTTPGL